MISTHVTHHTTPNTHLTHTPQHNAQELAGTYGVRSSYTALAHLRWAVRRANATATAYCLDLLGSLLAPLKRSEAERDLLPQARPRPRAMCCVSARVACPACECAV